MGLGDKAEGAQVAQTYPSQDDVAEFTTGRLDHRGVPKSAARSQNSFKGGTSEAHKTHEVLTLKVSVG